MKNNKTRLVIIRHGESLGNIENRFTGWLDVDLTKKGWLNSYKVGVKLYNLKYNFDVCYTSMLKRAIKTCLNIINSMRILNVKFITDKNLNERCYGGISGLNKLESSIRYTNEKVNKWLNDYNSVPPKIYDYRLSQVFKVFKKNKNKCNESVKDLYSRIISFWKKIKNLIINKKRILIVAHSNVIKLLTNIIDKTTSNRIVGNSQPIVYEFSCDFKKVKKYTI